MTEHEVEPGALSPDSAGWHWRAVLVVFAVAFVLRAGWGMYRMSTAGATTLEFPDEEQYWLMATSLHDGIGLVDELGFRAGRMPLYPGLLSIAAGSAGNLAIVRIAQWLIGGLGAVFAMRLGEQLANRKVGLLAGLLFAADPFLVFFSNLILTETLFVTLLVALWSYGLGFVVQHRGERIRQWLTLGALSLACVYARESTLGLIGVALLIHLIRCRFRRSVLVGVVVVGGVVVAGLFPWAFRNHKVIGEWCWLTTRAGISLYDGVGPQATGAGDLGDIKDCPEVRELSEVERNSYFLGASFARMRADPGHLVKLALHKFLRMWSPVPNAADYQSRAVRLISALWMVPLLLLAVGGLFVLRKMVSTHAGGLIIYLLLPAFYLSVLHMVFVGSVRYRLGAMPMLGVLAAVTLERLWSRTREP
ncbi:MAG: glycosyltransferase family 39 protein [Phycisphaerae bacterium]|nr:glycosyltransferase family 39 protein [Phycisphaerae bacterium]